METLAQYMKIVEKTSGMVNSGKWRKSAVGAVVVKVIVNITKGPEGPLMHWVLFPLFFPYRLFALAFLYTTGHFVLIAVFTVLAAHAQ